MVQLVFLTTALDDAVNENKSVPQVIIKQESDHITELQPGGKLSLLRKMTLSYPFLMTYSSEIHPSGEQIEDTGRDGKLSYSGVSQRPLTHGHYCKPAHRLPRNNNEHKRRQSTVLTQGNSVHFWSKKIALYTYSSLCVGLFVLHPVLCWVFYIYLQGTIRLLVCTTLHSHDALTHLIQPQFQKKLGHFVKCNQEFVILLILINLYLTD